MDHVSDVITCPRPSPTPQVLRIECGRDLNTVLLFIRTHRKDATYARYLHLFSWYQNDLVPFQVLQDPGFQDALSSSRRGDQHSFKTIRCRASRMETLLH